MIHGHDLILSTAASGTGLFAYAKTCKVATSTKFIEVCSPTDGQWEDYVPTSESWSASTDCLIATLDNYKQLRAMQDSRTALSIRFFDRDMQIFYKGTAYIKQLELQATEGSLAKMGIELQTTGALTAAEEVGHRIATTYYNHDREIHVSSSTGRVVIGQTTEQDPNGVIYEEITTTAAKTKITVKNKVALLHCSMSVLNTILTTADDVAFNTLLLAYTTTGSKSVIVEAGTYVVIENYDDQEQDTNDYYLMEAT